MSSTCDARLPAVERDPDLVLDLAERRGVDAAEDVVVDAAAELGPHRAARPEPCPGSPRSPRGCPGRRGRAPPTAAPVEADREGDAGADDVCRDSSYPSETCAPETLTVPWACTLTRGPLEGQVAGGLDRQRAVGLDAHGLALDRVVARGRSGRSCRRVWMARSCSARDRDHALGRGADLLVAAKRERAVVCARGHRPAASLAFQTTPST